MFVGCETSCLKIGDQQSKKNHMEIGLKSGQQHPSMAILPFVPLIFHLGQYTIAQLCELIYSRQIWFNTQQKINMR